MSGFPGKPLGIKAPHGAREFEVRWPGDKVDRIPHRALRGFCPCAGCQGHSGVVRFQDGHNLELRDIEAVGNYALGLTWADGHSTGIYTFAYLYRLARLLEEHGPEGLELLETLPEDPPAE